MFNVVRCDVTSQNHFISAKSGMLPVTQMCGLNIYEGFIHPMILAKVVKIFFSSNVVQKDTNVTC